MITLTQKNLHALSASPGQAGFTKQQIELLGFTWPPRAGWLKSLIGTEISEERYEEIKGACRQKWKDIGEIQREPKLTDEELRILRQMIATHRP